MPAQGEHIFEGHLLGVTGSGPGLRIVEDEVWPSVLLVICLVLLALVKLRSFPRVVRIVQSTFSNQILQQLEREEINTFRAYSIALSGLFAINLSFIFYKLNNQYQLILNESLNLTQYFFFLTVVSLVLILKSLLNGMLGYFTGDRKTLSEYQMNSMLINQAFGLFLFPCIVFMEFSELQPDLFLWTGITIAGAGLLIKWYRGLMMSAGHERIGLLQIFSYFCGLEILPVFVLVKYIIETF